MVTVVQAKGEELERAFSTLGFLNSEAALHVEAGRTEWFFCRGLTEPLPRRLHAALIGEGIVRYEAADGTAILLGGCRSAWRALLARFPDESGWTEIGERIAKSLGLPWSLRAVTRLAGEDWHWGERTYVMGILNVTPDSFSDGGKYLDLGAAVAHAEKMLAEGADFIDVGGESTRPGADPVPESEELRRVVPVVEAIVKRLSARVSVDTYKSAVAKAAVEAGAAVINDVTGLRGDPRMAEVAAELGVPIILQHIQGSPKNMQQDPRYVSVVPEVLQGLKDSADRALAAGVRPENIIVDPGFGFGKRLEHNLTLLARLAELRTLGYPVLSGTSRKSMVGAVLGLPVSERVEGTAATVALSVAGRADIVRVHDVGIMVRTVKVADATFRDQLVVRR